MVLRIRLKFNKKKSILLMNKVVKDKKRWYGLKKLTKEENSRLRMRTEERMDIARGKTNLWRKFGLGRVNMDIKEEELEALEEIRRRVLELEEEDGERLEKEVDIKNINIRRPKLFKEGEEVKEQEAAASGLRGTEVARRNCQGAAKGGGELDEGVRTKGLDTARSNCQGGSRAGEYQGGFQKRNDT